MASIKQHSNLRYISGFDQDYDVKDHVDDQSVRHRWQQMAGELQRLATTTSRVLTPAEWRAAFDQWRFALALRMEHDQLGQQSKLEVKFLRVSMQIALPADRSADHIDDGADDVAAIYNDMELKKAADEMQAYALIARALNMGRL